ncbi:CBS domain-containing protein CBSX3, mitochondrial [Linum perenne]
MLLYCAAALLMLLTLFSLMLLTIQGAIGAFFSRAGVVKTTLRQHVRVLIRLSVRLSFPDLSPSPLRLVSRSMALSIQQSLTSCQPKKTQHNVGALVVVKPGEQKVNAGIITERDYLRKIIV